MEALCRKCTNDCKQEATRGYVMRYCGDAPEGKRALENAKRSRNGKKKNKSNKDIQQGSGKVVWNATDWKGKRNNSESTEHPVADERQERKVANL